MKYSFTHFECCFLSLRKFSWVIDKSKYLFHVNFVLLYRIHAWKSLLQLQCKSVLWKVEIVQKSVLVSYFQGHYGGRNSSSYVHHIHIKNICSYLVAHAQVTFFTVIQPRVQPKEWWHLKGQGQVTNKTISHKGFHLPS